MKQYLSLILVFFLFNCGDKDSQEAAEFFERGVFHFKKNELDDAYRFFTEAIKKEPNLSDAYNNIGLIEEIRGDNKLALEAFEKAILIDQKFEQAIFNKSRILSQIGRNDEALVSLNSVIEAYRDSADFYLVRGFVNMNKNQTEAAIIDFERAIYITPQNSQALTNLGYAYIVERKFSLAFKNLYAAIKQNPEEAAAHNNLAFLYGITSKPVESLSEAELAVKLEPVNVLYRNNYCYSLLLNNNLKLAATQLEIVSKSLSNNSYYLRNKGLLKHLEKNYQAARELFLLSEKSDPGTELIYYYLGLNELRAGNLSEAKLFFIRGAKLDDGRSSKELEKL